MKTAFITGVTGQDGSYLAELLLNKGYKVIGLKRRTSLICTDRINGFYDHENFELRYFELNDAGCMWRLLQEYKPDEIYNLAAQSHVRVSFEVAESTVDGIAMGTLKLLEATRHITPNARFYQASSSEMYGDNPNYPQDENTRLMPASPYACAKVFSHNLVRNYRGLCCNKTSLMTMLLQLAKPIRLKSFLIWFLKQPGWISGSMLGSIADYLDLMRCPYY